MPCPYCVIVKQVENCAAVIVIEPSPAGEWADKALAVGWKWQSEMGVLGKVLARQTQ